MLLHLIKNGCIPRLALLWEWVSFFVTVKRAFPTFFLIKIEKRKMIPEFSLSEDNLDLKKKKINRDEYKQSCSKSSN